MADDLNSLLQANRSASVLQGIANPAQVNPLAAMNSAAQTAGNVFQVRQLQAQQALGNILQQATGPEGVVDHQRAQALAAQAGPGVQMGMQSFLTNNSALRGAQTKQAGELHGLVGSMGASLMNDPSDANLAKIRAGAVAVGLPPSALAEIDRIAALPAAQRGAEAYKHVVANIDALGQLARGGLPTPQMMDVGGRSVPVAVQGGTPWTPGSATVQQGGVGLGLTPAQLAQPVSYTGANGVTVNTTLGEHLTTMGVNIPQGGGQIGGAGGAPTGPPSALPVNQNAPGCRPRPAATTEKPALMPPPATAAAAPAGKSIPGPLPGQEADTTAWQAGNAAMDPMKARETAGVAALQALELAHTGYGTPGVNRVKAFMIAQGIPGAGLIDQGGVEAYQLARKQLLRFAQDSSKTSGTNLGLETQLASNANVESMLNATNEHILKQDLGQLRQRMAMQLTAPNRGIGGTEFGSGHGEHTKNFLPQTDPVAFAWDKISPEERAAHLAQIENNPTAKARWMRSMRIARDKGIISVPGQ